MMIADLNLNVATRTMQCRLHRQLRLLQSLRRRHGPSRFETGQATPPRSGPVRFGGPERRQPLPAYLALVCRRQHAAHWQWHCWQSAATGVTRRRISTPWAPHARCDLVSALAYTGTAEQSCKIDSYADLSKLRTVDHDMYSKFVKKMDAVKSQRKSIPPASKEVGWDIVFYPTYLEKGGMEKLSIPATPVG